MFSNQGIVPKLGVGLAYQPALRPFLDNNPDAFDYIEVVPDMLWMDRGRKYASRYIDDAEGVHYLEGWTKTHPIIPHSIGLSVGSAHLYNAEHLEQIAKWWEWLDFPWHSDHLAYHLAEHGVDEMNVGVTVPLPRDKETLEFLVPRVQKAVKRLDIPFLLENAVYFFDFEESEFSDSEFLNRLCDLTGCYLLLDLHNIYVNAVNHGGDPFSVLEGIEPDVVLEMHVAGGMYYEDTYLDAHSGPMPETVVEMLDVALARFHNLGGVTFELLGSWYDNLGEERLLQELSTMRALWQKHQPLPTV